MLYHHSEIGMNKTPRKRIPMPLLPPQEPGTNGMFYLERGFFYVILTFLSFRRDQEDAGIVAIPSSWVSPLTPPPQRSFLHALLSGQRRLNPRKWETLSINPFAPASVKKIKTRTVNVNVTSGIRKAKSDFVV